MSQQSDMVTHYYCSLETVPVITKGEEPDTRNYWTNTIVVFILTSHDVIF